MENLLRELNILKTMNIKPNYSALSRIHSINRNTIRKYDNGYKGKPMHKNKMSVLDKYKEDIASKLTISGTRISSVYQYFFAKDDNIGTESNFRKYVAKHKLAPDKNSKVHPRYETPPGLQMQFDWKENIKMTSKFGEVFEFNVLTSILSYSRKHIFEYSRTKTWEDVLRCLTNTFKSIKGVPMICLTDNMSSIVTNGKFSDEFIAYSRDFGFRCQKCKVYTPETKGKVESKNRFLNWLKPYNFEFETEKELIDIIKKIEDIANEKENATTGIKPNLLYQKEIQHLQSLPNSKIIEAYLELNIPLKVSIESLIHYKGKKYSVPHKYINKIENVLNIYFNGELIRQHEISNKPINYDKDDYLRIFKSISYHNDIENLAFKNLELMDMMGEKI